MQTLQCGHCSQTALFVYTGEEGEEGEEGEGMREEAGERAREKTAEEDGPGSHVS